MEIIVVDSSNLLRMFEVVHGEFTGACSTEVYYVNELEEAAGVNVMKHGQMCWGSSLAEILFDYITKDWS